MLLFIGGMMLGAILGIGLHCMLIVAKEADEIFSDSNEYEVRVLVDVLKAAKESMRNIKIFQDGMKSLE